MSKRGKGFSDATLRVIEALEGDLETGKCFCPVHDDGSKPSLHVKNGDSQPVVLHCFGGGQPHDDKIVEWLKARGAWPSSTHLRPEHTAGTQQKSKTERRNHAVKIWNDLINSSGQDFAPVLKQYLQPRGIKRVPTTALMVMPVGYSPESTVEAYDFGMVLPIRNSAGKLMGIQATWLKPDLTAKREDEPQRQSYGLVKGNFVELTEIDYSTMLDALVIGEGVETTLAGMQLTGLPVASAGAWNIIKPPSSRRYIILADNGDAGQKFARDQATRIRALYADAVIQIVTPVRPEKGKAGYDWADALMESRDPTVLKKEILKAPEFSDDKEPDEDVGEAVRRKQVDSLVELAADAELFHTSDLVGHADMTIDAHRETWPIKSKGFRSWLLYQYYLVTGSAPSGEALRLAIERLDAKARYDGPTLNVYLRVGGNGDKIYIDLCDKEWRAVEIDRDGWRVVSLPPIRFRRAPGMLSLPTPVKGGSIDELRRFVNLKNNGDFVPLVSFIVAALRDRGPYPGLALKGEEGSAKSTLAKLTRDLIDPHKVRARSLPRENRDLHVAANASHVIAFDNVSAIPDWLSDALCSLATGGGFATRALYTDMDEVLFEAMRPVILNGIEYATRSDLADRLIFLNLPPITDDTRFTEREFWAKFEVARPRILGALCGAIVHGLRMLPDTPADNLPRLADYAMWSAAWEGALFEPGSFQNAYARNRKGATLDVIENDDVAVAVRKLMTRQDEWAGTATELLYVLGRQVGEKIEKSKEWPASAKSLGSKLRRAAKPLRKIGIEIDKERRGDRRGTRAIVIRRQYGKVRKKTCQKRQSCQNPVKPSL